MSADAVIWLIVSLAGLGLFAYLLVALIRPEKW